MILEPMCFTRGCKNFIGVKRLGKYETTEVCYCKAFNEGIPREIAYGDNPHKEPYPNDGGIHFENGS